MANHKSSLKRIRQDKKKAEHNHYYAKTMRNAVRKLRAMTNKDEAVALYSILKYRRCWTSWLRPTSFTRTRPLT